MNPNLLAEPQQKLISVHNLIDKPKQLINKQTVNKVYRQNWEPIVFTDASKEPNNLQLANKKDKQLQNDAKNQKQESRYLRMTCSVIVRTNWKKSLGKLVKCATQMQMKNISKFNKIKNMRYNNNNDKKYSLTQLQQMGVFGQLVYQRTSGKYNWNWQVKTQNFTCNYQPEPELTSCLLTFSSCFQSSNLFRAYTNSVSTSTNLLGASTPIPIFTLLTHNDTNTFGYGQWFYFKAKSQKSFEAVRFQIVNMRKKYSLFQQGMKIAIFSQKKWKQEGIGWTRGGTGIEYGSNGIEEMNTLGWDYVFEGANEWVYFAYSYPYCYADLKLMISKCKKFSNEGQWIQLCLTALKNQIYMLKIDKKLQTHQKSLQLQKQADLSTSKQRTSPKRLFSKQQHPSIKDLIEQQNKQQRKQRQFMSPLGKRIRNKSKYLNLNIQKKLASDFAQPINEQKNLNPCLEAQQNTEQTTINVNQLQNRSHKQSKKPFLSQFLRQSRNKSFKQQQKITNSQPKQILIIMARSHPGETPSSLVMEGIIASLLKQKGNQFRYLKQRLKIYVIPMINPDGVIHGNTRTSLTGNDLNRRWTNPHPLLHPEIYQIKQYFQDLVNKGNKIFAVVDLHGHTKKQSSFLYGCCDKKNYHNHAQIKLLNSLMGRVQHNFNSLYSSHFVGESKRSTARITFYRQFKCFSYTLQASFLGQDEGSLHFSIMDYFNIGQNLLKSLAFLHSATRKQKSLNKIIVQPQLNNFILRQAVLDHFQRQKKRITKIQKQYEKQQSEGSSSAPSECNYCDEDLLKNLFDQQKQRKGESRYKTRSLNKVGRRNMSLSISDKQSVSLFYESPDKIKNTRRQKFLKAKKYLESGEKLPQIHQKQQEEYEFHAFNFKSKKGGIRKKKALPLVDSTIE